jgi:hypothetical protein
MVKCRFCGTENRPGSQYCNHCGGAFAAAPASPARAAAGAAPSARASATAGGAAPTARPANPTGSLPPQTRLHGRYVILATVGQGGMAAVYRALDVKNNAQVAVKEMSQDGLTPAEEAEAVAAFSAEADMLRRLRHSNLPRVYERFSEGARHYLVMEFVDGQTLEQRQQAAGGRALPEAEVMDWARQLCSVLTYLHGQNPPIIFRDLKPANVMVTPQGRVKLIDFGIARVFNPARVKDTQVLGTPGFAPPEQYGKAQTDPRADVYALGVTLYQMLTGYDPATTPFSLPPAHTLNPRIAPHIQAALERATRLDRDARYRSAAELERDLLHPDGFVFRNGRRAHSPAELMALCNANPQEAQEHLYARRFEGWLAAIGQPALARTAQQIVAAGGDRAAGLQSFLAQVARPQTGAAAGAARAGARAGAARAGAARAGTGGAAKAGTAGGTAKAGAAGGARAGQGAANPAASLAGRMAKQMARQVASATAKRLFAQAAAATAAAVGTQIRVEVRPSSVNFGALIAGQRGAMSIAVAGQNGLPVNGRIEPGDPWLRVDRTTFAGPSTIVQVTAETARLATSGLHRSYLRVVSGGQQLYIPVSVEVLNTRAPNAPPPRPGGGPGGPAAAKHAPAPAAPRWLRTILSWLAAFGAAAWAYELLIRPIHQAVGPLGTPAAPHAIPVALAPTLPTGLLLLALLVAAAPAAVAGRWGPRLLERLGTAAVSGAFGAAAALVLAQDRALHLGRAFALLPAARLSTAFVVVAVLGVSLGAALGAQPDASRRLLLTAAWAARHSRLLLGMGAAVAGAWLGGWLISQLPQPAALAGLLVPLGGLVGMLLALSLAGRVSRLLQRAASHPGHP